MKKFAMTGDQTPENYPKGNLIYYKLGSSVFVVFSLHYD
jgi:hypothetical protein